MCHINKMKYLIKKKINIIFLFVIIIFFTLIFFQNIFLNEKEINIWCNPEIGVKIDNLSEICWQKSLSYKHRNWYEAIDYCNELEIDSYNWDLPKKYEIEKLITYLRNVDDPNYYILSAERINFISYLINEYNFSGIESLWDWYWTKDDVPDMKNFSYGFSLYGNGYIDHILKNDTGERSRKRVICISKKN